MAFLPVASPLRWPSNAFGFHLGTNLAAASQRLLSDPWNFGAQGLLSCCSLFHRALDDNKESKAALQSQDLTDNADIGQDTDTS
jgi:hypothetical protein